MTSELLTSHHEVALSGWQVLGLVQTGWSFPGLLQVFIFFIAIFQLTKTKTTPQQLELNSE